ncbi:CBN-PME-5 protein, partial [Aphelenchoides avenae]
VLSADKWGNTALHYAAQRGANICTVTLLRHGLPVNKANNAGNTPLALATMNGHESVTLTLIQAQSDISLKAYGPTPPTADERLVRWTWVPRRPKPEKRFEAAISALVVRNGWQGIIYVILDVLKKSRETLIRLVAAALDHEKYNLAQTLLRMLKDVPVSSGGAVNGTPNGPVLTREDAVDVFYIFATHTSVSDARAPVLRMLFEAGLEWTQPDGTSRCVEELGRHGTISELMAIRTLDGELRSFKGWNRMLQTNSVKVLLRNLVEYWCSAGRRSTGAYDDVLSVYVRQFPEYMNVSKELLEFEKPAFEGMESAQPKSPVAETERVTVLIRAIQRRCLDLVKFLVEEMKVDANAADEKGRTPLMHAVAANNVAAVHLLMGKRLV